MLRKFLRDERGGYAIITVLAMVPIMGALALALDFAEMSRQRQITLNALDAAGVATAGRISGGATDAEALTYAGDFFKANLVGIDPAKTTLEVDLPTTALGGGKLKLHADLDYDPYFLPAFRTLLTGTSANVQVTFDARSEVRLKNTLEVSLVLDNSGSMLEKGEGSDQVRFDLLKSAAKQLVDEIAEEAKMMRQIPKPVQFAVVPFAASVNIGASNAGEPWMDTTGISPIHHENFDWTTLSSANNSNQYAQKSGLIWYARGTGWGTAKDKPLTRFTIYDKMQRVSAENCKTRDWRGNCTAWNSPTYDSVAAWGGCVEARPYPDNVNDETASSSTPATLFVPMFAPDETDNTDGYGRPANNNWRADRSSATNPERQRYMPKYFNPGTTVTPAYGVGAGPNTSCTTKAITPLTDVSKAEGLEAVKKAIDDMTALGATNVPEGMAWGWRTLSSKAPFTGGRSEAEFGNDKVVIVLTDGANTYYTPSSVRVQSYSGPANYTGGGNDLADTKAIYSAAGYLKTYGKPYTYGRLFLGTTGISKSDYSNENYSKAMNEHFATLCTNAKAGKIIVMTVALDLDAGKTAEKAQIDAMTACASESRFRKDENGNPDKLFWNTTGADLDDVFEKIADELSNLRIVG